MAEGLILPLGPTGDEVRMGGKGARLRALMRHAAVVAPGFVTAGAFRQFMDRSGL